MDNTETGEVAEKCQLIDEERQTTAQGPISLGGRTQAMPAQLEL